jgi:hypothetical protein
VNWILHETHKNGQTLRHSAPVNEKAPAICGGFPIFNRPYLFAVLSRKGRFVAVVETTVMSPRALIVYVLPFTNCTAVLAMAFVADPATRVPRS